MTSTTSTARCGPACRVVWEGGAGQLGNAQLPLPILRRENCLSVYGRGILSASLEAGIFLVMLTELGCVLLRSCSYKCLIF